MNHIQYELPFDPDAKIYKIYCCEQCECENEPQFESYNDMLMRYPHLPKFNNKDKEQ